MSGDGRTDITPHQNRFSKYLNNQPSHRLAVACNRFSTSENPPIDSLRAQQPLVVVRCWVLLQKAPPHPLKRPPPTSDLNNKSTSSRHAWKASSTRLKASLFRFAASLNSWLSVTTSWAFHQPPLPAEFSPEALRQTKRNNPETKHHATQQEQKHQCLSGIGSS